MLEAERGQTSVPNNTLPLRYGDMAKLALTLRSTIGIMRLGVGQGQPPEA